VQVFLKIQQSKVAVSLGIVGLTSRTVCVSVSDLWLSTEAKGRIVGSGKAALLCSLYALDASVATGARGAAFDSLVTIL
jgi:hypothetical protein